MLVITEEGSSVKIPSDLAGITRTTYSSPKASNASSEWDSALRPAARKVRDAIERRVSSDLGASLPGTARGPVSGGAGTPADWLAWAATLDAQRGYLANIEAVSVGDLVVHSLHGVGQIVGFDPDDDDDQYVRVRFGSRIAAVPSSELYEPQPRGAR